MSKIILAFKDDDIDDCPECSAGIVSLIIENDCKSCKLVSKKLTLERAEAERKKRIEKYNKKKNRPRGQPSEKKLKLVRERARIMQLANQAMMSRLPNDAFRELEKIRDENGEFSKSAGARIKWVLEQQIKLKSVTPKRYYEGGFNVR